MSVSWKSTTNKKLHHVRVLLDAWSEADSASSAAFRESCILQLGLAYRSLLSEILESYGIQSAAVSGLPEAVKLIGSKNTRSSELGQLQQLESSDSWLGCLLKELNQLNGPELNGASKENGEAYILATDTGQLAGINSVESARVMFESLKELVLHFRNFNLEW